MSQKDDRATRIADLLGIKYAHAVRLIRQTLSSSNADFTFSDLAHACRELKEKEEAEAPKTRRKRGVLPKGSGGVRCIPCGAHAAADGEGSPIVLKHDDDCPERYLIKDHLYDAGWPRDDSKHCIAIVNDSAFWSEEAVCGRPLSEHAKSEYPEDGR